MAFAKYPPENISEAITVFKQDVELAHGIVHGDENTEVLTENGLVPSFKNVIESLKEEVAGATGVDVSLRSELAAANSSVLVGGQPAGNVAGNVESNYTQNSLISVTQWQQGQAVNIGDYLVYRGVTWEANANGKVCGASPSFADFHIVSNDGKLWPDNFGATYIAGVNQTPAMQRMEDFARLVNKPTYYRPAIHYMLTKLSVNREPNMNGTGGGQSSIRNRKLNSDRRYTGTVFYSQVAGDYALDIDLPTYHFGGRIENISLVGRLDPTQPRNIGHGAIFGEWGWSAQVNNLSIEGFQGKNLTLNYMQDTVFNSLTLLDGSNGDLEPMLEFAAESNFIYFNNPHIEEFEYAIRVKSGTNAPWEVKFINGHFEAGNYTNGTTASAPDPSLERRYTSSPIYSASFVRDWTFEDCFFVPVSARALAADSDGLIDNKPYFIRFEDAEGVAFTGKTRVQAQGACDFLFLGWSATINEFGRNSLEDVTIRNANPTRYSLSINNTDINKIQMRFDGDLNSTRMYGINADNALLNETQFHSTDASAKTEGYLINTGGTRTVGVGALVYNLAATPFKFTKAGCYLLSSGHRSVVIPFNGGSGAIDMESLPHDAQLYADSVSPTTVNNITNAHSGKRLTISNRGAGNVTINASSTIRPAGGSIVYGQESASEFYSDDGVLRQIN